MKTSMIQVRVSPDEKRAYEKALAIDHSKSLGDFLRRAANDRLRLLMGKPPEPLEAPWKEFLNMVDKAPRVKADAATLRLVDEAQRKLSKGTMKVISAKEALKRAKQLASG